MAKKRQKTTRFSIQGFDLNHYRTTEQYAAAVQALFDRATLAMAKSAARRKIDPDKPFSFDDYPEVKAELKKIVGQLATQLQTTIESGSKNQWLFACEKNDGFIASIMDTSKLSKARLKKMQDRNLDALSTFQGRKVGGMNLSQRVWRYVGQYRDQLETALDVGLGEGRSAQELARDVKKNLRDPDRLFRRVRNKRGNLVLSKAARAFHPGQGVYRSSVKNAQRLTRSEINMAYRESDFLRWQQLDFVVGFEIHRSNHEPLCKCKMCDRLQGRYPKTFKFKGWHPQCMCYAVPILMDEETFDENELGDLKAALRGTEYKKKQAKNLVTDVPDGFKEWVAENMEASARWASTPYFIKDNFVDGDLAKGLKIALPEPEVDPVQAQLDALMPSVEAARKIAEEWGLELRLKGLDAAVAAKDVKDINKFISLITSEGTKYTTELSAFFKDAAQLIKDINAAGVGVLPDVVAELTQYMTNLSADKSMWADGGGAFYKSELEKAKDKLRQYKASPEAALSEREKRLLSETRTAIKEAGEWGIRTANAQSAVDTFIKNPSEDNYWHLWDAQCDMEKKIRNATKQLDKFLADADALIKEAAALGVDSAELRNHVLYLHGGDRAYSWVNFKRDRNKAFNDLKAKVDEAQKAEREKQATAQKDVLNPTFTGKPHPAMKTSYSTDSEVDATFTEINKDFTTEKWFEHGDLRLSPTRKSGVNGFTYMNGKISLTPDRLKRVKSALGKIGQGKSDEITFEEADAMATFWHEICHNRNIPSWTQGDKTKMQTRFMELANEFVARHTLPEFYAKLGASSLPHPEFQINRESTGYNKMVTNYDFVIKETGLDHAKVLASVRKHLFTGGYNDQQTGLAQALLDGGLTYADGTAVKKSDLNALLKLIRTLESGRMEYDPKTFRYVTTMSREGVILEWLKEHKFIK